MQGLFDIINVPLGWVLRFIADIFNNNFAIAVFIFTLLINILFIPLTIKSQKSSVQQLRLKPKLDELKKKYGDDRQKISQETSKLYQEEKVSMSGGCLPMIIRLVIMMSIYWLIMSPLTYMANVEDKTISHVEYAITDVISNDLNQIKDDDANKERQAELYGILGIDLKSSNNRIELPLANLIDDGKLYDNVEQLFKECKVTEVKIEKEGKAKTVEAFMSENLQKLIIEAEETDINYNFFTEKINLTDTPNFDWNIFNAFRPNWILPILAFVSQILSSILSMKMQKKTNPDAPSMSGMLLMMPVISLIIGFGLPCGVTFYWACSSLIGGLLQVAVQYYYGPHKLLAKMRGKELTKQCDFEAGQISKLSSDE